MRAFLAMLPPTAYGQVILAVDADQDAGTDPQRLAAQLDAPARVSVTTLTVAASADHAPGSALATRGVVLADAIAAWVAEWVPDEVALDRIVSMWVGGRGNAAVDALCDTLPDLQRL